MDHHSLNMANGNLIMDELYLNMNIDFPDSGMNNRSSITIIMNDA